MNPHLKKLFESISNQLTGQADDHDSKLYKLYNMLYDACQNEANNYGKQSSSRRQAIARRILTELPKSNV